MRHAILIVFAGLAGCSGPDAARVAVHPVAGLLLVDDRPAANARVAFHPVNGGAALPVGVTGPDGRFRLTTHAAADGAPAGDYVITVVWPNESLPVDECDITNPAAHDRLFGAYAAAATSPLRATVRPGANAVTLTAAVSGRGWNLPRRNTGN